MEFLEAMFITISIYGDDLTTKRVLDEAFCKYWYGKDT